MSDEKGFIQVRADDYLQLLSAKIVLDTLNNSIKVLKSSKQTLTTNNNNNSVKNSSTNKNKIISKSHSAFLSSFQITDLSNNFKLSNINNNPANYKLFLTNNDYVRTRKYFNSKRWNCISRPQYKYSCGISSLVSCWNYLYSSLGHGKLKPLTQEEAMKILGFQEPFDDIRFGPFTGNATLIRWFTLLNKHFVVEGQASYFYKPVGANKTFGINGSQAKNKLETELHSKNIAFIYHCYNHYCCPIGYEKEPVDRTKIYETDKTQKDKNSNSYREMFIDWILISDTSRKYPCFHCVKWEDIDKDLSLKSPEFLNIRHLERGVQTRVANNDPTKQNSNDQTQPKEPKKSTNDNCCNKNKQIGEKNLHCIIKFEKIGGSLVDESPSPTKQYKSILDEDLDDDEYTQNINKLILPKNEEEIWDDDYDLEDENLSDQNDDI